MGVCFLYGQRGGERKPPKPNVEIVPWATGTDAQIAAMVAAMDEGKLSVEDSGWQVGDMRKVSLGDMASTFRGAPNEAQDAVLVLANVGGKTLENQQECHFVVQVKNCLQGSTSMGLYDANSPDSWENTTCRAWCNTVLPRGIPETLLPIFKKFKNITGIPGSETEVQETLDLFAFVSEGEFFGFRSFSSEAEFQAQKQFKWFKVRANRNLTYRFWFRSPSCGNAEWWCAPQDSTTALTMRRSTNLYYLPFGCI